MTYYPRKIYRLLEKQVNSRPIVVLTGMRQVGKTTLYRALYESLKTDNKVFLDLENPIEQKIFEEKDYNNIIANLKEFGMTTKSCAYVFLDEIQAMPEVVRAVKYLHDHFRIKFFLTGSSSYYLKNLFPESLAGRKIIFELYPLDFEEFLVFQGEKRKFHNSFAAKAAKKNAIGFEKVKKMYDEYERFGGFPAVVLAEKNLDKALALKDIFTSYFEKDVKSLADFHHLRAFRDLMLLLMQRIGSKMDITKLASEVGVSRDTVYSYLTFLEQTYFVHFISPFSRSVDREVSGGRKVYLCDTGIVNQFTRVSEGAVFENNVYLNLRKFGQARYYQKRTGGEIDFIVRGKVACEVKMKGSVSDYQKLRRTASAIDIKQHYLITRSFMDEPFAILATDL